jgi:hypothetical protein
MKYDEAFTLLARLATAVGFAKRDSACPEKAPALPAQSQLWVASYSQLLVLPLDSDDEESVKEAARCGQDWLDLSCMKQEHETRKVVDGYLLILLPRQPNREVRALVRDLELNSTACRKHFAWPIGDTNEADLLWLRIFRVTCIGIPDSPASAGITGSPLLQTDLEKKLLVDVKTLKGKSAATQHAENPSLGPDP